MTEQKVKKYTVNYICTNCSKEFSESFDFGVPTSRIMDCPRCGCNTGRRPNDQMPIIGYPTITRRASYGGRP